ncbi:MAG: hypothetical protein JW969_09485 [Spirochaetales bacterium]|nr:hypothetical protein [Spirochaetales bacterium]
MDFKYFIAIVLGIVSFSLKNMGYVLQKKGVNEITANGAATVFKHFTNPSWLVGQVLPFAGAFILIVAYSYGPISVIMPFSGLSFIVLLLFCRYYLMEKISRGEIAAILAGIGGLTMLNVSTLNITDRLTGFRYFFLNTFNGFSLPVMGAPVLLALGFALICLKRKSRFRGPAFGVLAGMVGGVSLIVQKPFSMGLKELFPFNDLGINFVLLLVCGVVFITCVILAIYFLNLGYHFDRGVIVTPLYAVLQIVVPVLGGIVFFGEWNLLEGCMIVLCILGLSVSLVSVGLFTYFGEKKREN